MYTKYKFYHFVHTILSVPFCPYHFVRIPFCPLPFCPYHFVRYHFVRSPAQAVRLLYQYRFVKHITVHLRKRIMFFYSFMTSVVQVNAVAKRTGDSFYFYYGLRILKQCPKRRWIMHSFINSSIEPSILLLANQEPSL